MTVRHLPRRRALAGMLLLPVVLPGALTGCGLLGRAATPPDPLRDLADAARADATLATAAIAADPGLADRVQPFVDARVAHAEALDAEVARLDPDAATEGTDPSARPTPAASAAEAGLAQVQEAALAAARTAGERALELSADRVGLVAAIAACCSAYAAVLV